MTYLLPTKKGSYGMAHKFKVATAAGTFDYFHKGHKQFLLAAFDAADTIYIGITSDSFAKAKRLGQVAPFASRRREVETFLKINDLFSHAKIIELADIYGPTLDPDCPIEAVIVSENTRYGAELINKLRKKKGLSSLEVITLPLVQAVDGGELSSSRIRNGEIDRGGNLWVKPAWLEKTLQLPDTLRPQLQKPIGKLIKGSESDLSQAVKAIKTSYSSSQSDVTSHESRSFSSRPIRQAQGEQARTITSDRPTIIITVGDVVAKSFNEGGLVMDIAVVDYHVRRTETFKNLPEIGFKKKEPDATVKNPKGMLTGETFKAVQKAIRFITPRMVARQRPRLLRGGPSPLVIRVIGEEDLATLAAVLAAPLGAHVFYGQPNEGIVQVVVTEKKKSEIRDIVSQFT